MTRTADQFSAYAAQLREEFDHAFSLPARVETTSGRHLLAIRVAGHPYALNPEEIAGLQVDQAVVPVPGMLPEWLGLAGIRGGLVPVFSLAMLLGYERPTPTRPRWLAVCGSGQLFGLAFDEFERHLNLAPSQIAAADSVNTKTEHVLAVAQAEDMPRPVISIPSIAAEITRRCATVTASKEK